MSQILQANLPGLTSPGCHLPKTCSALTVPLRSLSCCRSSSVVNDYHHHNVNILLLHLSNQVYSPDNKSDSAFHRSLFVFLCVASPCWEQGKEPPVLVLRSQLARSNPFYPWQPPEERDGWRDDIKAETHGKLCAVCGCRADKSCAQCKNAHYCSEKHQRADWKAGHKSTCKGGRRTELPPKSSLLLPEGLIESEPEPKKGVKDDAGQNIDQFR